MFERFSDALSEPEPEPEAVTVRSVKGNVCGRCEANRLHALPFTEMRDTSSRGSAQANTELKIIVCYPRSVSMDLSSKQ